MNEEYEGQTFEETETLKEAAKLDGAASPAFASEEYLKKAEEPVFPNDFNNNEAESLSSSEKENNEQSGGYDDMNEQITDEKSTDLQAADVSYKPVSDSPSGLSVLAESEETDPEHKGLENTAEVFGLSKAELENEFKRYKADRLFAKVNLDLTNADMPYKEALRQLTDAAAYNIYSATVLPNFAPMAIKSNPTILLNVAVGYPYGVETLAVKKFMVKRAARLNVHGIVMYVDTLACKEMKKRALAKELKKLKRAAGKKHFSIALDIAKFTLEELQALSDAVISSEIKQVVALADTKSSSVDEYALVRLCGMAKDKFEVIAASSFGAAEKVIGYYEMGVTRFSCQNAVELAKSFKQKLGV